MKKQLKLFFAISFIILVVSIYNPFSKTNEEKIVVPPSDSTSTQEKPNEVGDCLEEAFANQGLNKHSSKNGWEIIWQDEFEGKCLDSRKWNIEDWAAEKNNELQYYTPNNVKVEDGLLKLISKNERYRGRYYTSGAVHTKDKFSFLYGRAEMRAKLPAGQGIFPAFWMMTDKDQTWLPEIDIMEMLGHKPNEIWMVLHWLGNDGSLKSTSTSYTGLDYSMDFHTYSIEWTPDSITWFIDGIERFKTNKFIPQEKMYLYLNTAVGGNWPGSPDDTTIFPTIFEVDYVRVYMKSGE